MRYARRRLVLTYPALVEWVLFCLLPNLCDSTPRGSPGTIVSQAMHSSAVAASGARSASPASDAAPSARGVRGVFAMPVEWAREALDDLVGRGVIDAAAAEQREWGDEVSRYTAVIAFDRARDSLGMPEVSGDSTASSYGDVPRSHPAYGALHRCVTAGITGSEAAPFRGDASLTRLEFARWLDGLIGVPSLPTASSSPEQVLQLMQDGDPTSVREALWAGRELFDDIPSEADSALVNRLQWWLILRLPRYGRCPHRFEPDRAVSWNDFVVCLRRAIGFIDTSPVDVSTPLGSIRAMKRAFWRCDFAEMDRYVEVGAIRPGAAIHEVEAHAIRFGLCDAAEFMDSRVTQIDHMTDQKARVILKGISPFDGTIQTEAVNMTKRRNLWMFHWP